MIMSTESKGAYIGGDNIAAIKRYKEHQILPGGFLMAVLEGDLYSAACRADMNNQSKIFSITKYIVETLPPESYGSVKKVSAWLNKKT